MRFMMVIKVPEYSGAPPQALQAAMGTLLGEMMAQGRIHDMGGLTPMAQGTVLRLAGARIQATDGPFAETKEVLGGYVILKDVSRDEALAFGRRFLQVHADILGASFGCALEVRQMDDAPAAPAADGGAQ